MALAGTTTIDFGAGGTDKTLFVSSPTIGGGSMVDAWLSAVATASNTADNHWFDDLNVMAGNIVPGSGFTIYAKANTGKAHGIYTIGWVHT